MWKEIYFKIFSVFLNGAELFVFIALVSSHGRVHLATLHRAPESALIRT